MAGADRLTELSDDLGARLDVPGGPVVVALSGGADSAALLWLLTRRGAEVRAVHVIHGLPGSALMSAAAGQIAAACGAPLRMVVVDPAGTSEDALREARLAALAEASGGLPVLVAHTSDDQAETVLMRILRGTGPEGLAGIPAARGPFVRPMLTVTREEARSLATLAGLPFRDDPANADPSILRNRVRTEVLPLLEELTRSPREALLRLSETAERESGELADLARSIPAEGRGGAVRMPVGSLLAAGDVVAARAIRLACVRVAGPHPPDRAATGRILDVVAGRAVAAEVTPGLRAALEGAHLVIGAGDDLPPVPERGQALATGGVTVWGEWRFEVDAVTGPAVAPLSVRSLLIPEQEAERLLVRVWRPDDRVTGRRAEDALKDAAVTAPSRPGWPIVEADGEPVWLPGVRRATWPAHEAGRYLVVVASQEPRWLAFEP